MKKLLLTFTLLLTLGLSFQGVAAQVDAPDVEIPSLEDIEGLETAYGRAYTVDIDAMMEDPEFDIASMDPAAMSGNISIQGYTFDSEDNAKKFVEDSRSDLEEGIENNQASMEDMEINISELEDFDKDGIYVEMKVTGDMEINNATLMFVDGETVFQVSSMAGTLEDSKTQAYDVANYVVDTEVENDEVTFNADGTSTGGVFDRMPAADNEILGDLVPTMDMDLFNPTGGL